MVTMLIFQLQDSFHMYELVIYIQPYARAFLFYLFIFKLLIWTHEFLFIQ